MFRWNDKRSKYSRKNKYTFILGIFGGNHSIETVFIHAYLLHMGRHGLESTSHQRFDHKAKLNGTSSYCTCVVTTIIIIKSIHNVGSVKMKLIKSHGLLSEPGSWNSVHREIRQWQVCGRATHAFRRFLITTGAGWHVLFGVNFHFRLFHH